MKSSPDWMLIATLNCYIWEKNQYSTARKPSNTLLTKTVFKSGFPAALSLTSEVSNTQRNKDMKIIKH